MDDRALCRVHVFYEGGGGMGLDVDYPLRRYCLWARQLELTLGSSIDEIDRLGARLPAAS